jgi:hypothetical protein
MLAHQNNIYPNFREVEMIYFEMKSLFFCLIKRTKIKAVDGYELGGMIYE